MATTNLCAVQVAPWVFTCPQPFLATNPFDGAVRRRPSRLESAPGAQLSGRDRLAARTCPFFSALSGWQNSSAISGLENVSKLLLSCSRIPARTPRKGERPPAPQAERHRLRRHPRQTVGQIASGLLTKTAHEELFRGIIVSCVPRTNGSIANSDFARRDNRPVVRNEIGPLGIACKLSIPVHKPVIGLRSGSNHFGSRSSSASVPDILGESRDAVRASLGQIASIILGADIASRQALALNDERSFPCFWSCQAQVKPATPPP